MLFNIALVIPFYFLWQIGHVGLALATSLSAFVNAGLLYRGLRKDGVYQPMNGWLIYAMRLVLASGVMVAVLYAALYFIEDWSLLAAWERALSLAVVCVAGLVAYVVVLLLAGLRLCHLKR